MLTDRMPHIPIPRLAYPGDVTACTVRHLSPQVPVSLVASLARRERGDSFTTTVGQFGPMWISTLGRRGPVAGFTPLTVQTVTAISDGKRAAMVVFLRDDVIDAGEQRAIDIIDAACRQVERYDLSRRAATYLADTGTLPDGMEPIDLSPWLQRQWRELHRDDPQTA